MGGCFRYFSRMICVCCILLCGFYLRGPCTIGPQVGKVAEKDDALTTWTSQIEAGHDHGAATEALAWWFIYVYIYICIYIRGIILIISPQGSGSWIIIIYLECYGVVPPIWFPCRVFPLRLFGAHFGSVLQLKKSTILKSTPVIKRGNGKLWFWSLYL